MHFTSEEALKEYTRFDHGKGNYFGYPTIRVSLNSSIDDGYFPVYVHRPTTSSLILRVEAVVLSRKTFSSPLVTQHLFLRLAQRNILLRYWSRIIETLLMQ